MYRDFAPLPNKASALVDAMSISSRPRHRYPSDYVRPPRRTRTAWAGTMLGFLAAVAVTGLWFMA